MTEVSRCKYCKGFITAGLINEFNEHFCNENHYKLYCAINGFDAMLDRLMSFNYNITE